MIARERFETMLGAIWFVPCPRQAKRGYAEYAPHPHFGAVMFPGPPLGGPKAPGGGRQARKPAPRPDPPWTGKKTFPTNFFGPDGPPGKVEKDGFGKAKPAPLEFPQSRETPAQH